MINILLCLLSRMLLIPCKNDAQLVITPIPVVENLFDLWCRYSCTYTYVQHISY